MKKEFAPFISLITFLSPSCLTFCLLCPVVLVCAACHRALPGSFDRVIRLKVGIRYRVVRARLGFGLGYVKG
jgi:hypothetical protein